MRFLEKHKLMMLNQQLISDANEGRVSSKVEFFEIDPEDIEEFRKESSDRAAFQRSPDSFSPNLMYNFDVFANSASFPALKASISAAFPDWDFSSSCPWHFKLIQSVGQVYASLSWFVTNNYDRPEALIALLWKTICDLSPLSQTDVYSYEPDCPDAFSDMGVISHLTYFFVNHKRSTILLVHMREGSGAAESSMSEDEIRYNYDLL